MAFIFDATIGGTASNSYATTAELDDYFDGRYPNDLWTGLSTTDKQRIAVTATRRLEQESWSGVKVDETQALDFPRDAIFNSEGRSYSTTEIPTGLVNALGELAYFLLSSDDRILSELDLHDANSLSTYSVGPLDYGFKGKIKANELPQNVKDELDAIGDAWVNRGKNPTLILR